MAVESPPLVSFNAPAQSSGALFSAQIKLNVTEPEITVKSFEVQLVCSVSVKRPISDKCPDCTTKTTELKKWNFAPEPLKLSLGEHRFPLSFLFPGHLPATTQCNLATLDYRIAGTVITTTGETFTIGRPIELKRAILQGNDKHSVRIFPPTNLTAAVTLNPIVYPIGEFPVLLRLSGISSKHKDTISRWRVRKINWRIEEHQKMVSPACAKHAAKVGGEGRGIQHEDIRVIGENEVNNKTNPWKTDFDAGEVEVEFPAAINPSLKPVCNVEAPNGLSVTHNLVVEMVVAEEWAPAKRPTQATPTGAARILRMQFVLHITNRAGLGISWDEEQPPTYEDVPESPPGYSGNKSKLTHIEGQIDDLHLGDALHPHNYPNSPAMRPVNNYPNSPALRPIAGSSQVDESPAYEYASPRLTAVVSNSGSTFSQPGRPHGRFTVDDFLSEPTYPRREERDEEEEDEVDQASGTVS